MTGSEEKNLYRQFERFLDTLEYCRYKKTKGGMFQANEPDYLIIIRNRALWIEVKKRGEKPREAQVKRLSYWSKCCRAAWCDNLEDAKRIVLEEEQVAIAHQSMVAAMYE